MSNEAALIVIAAMWLKTGRGLNLCFVILCYYAIYLASIYIRGEPPDFSIHQNVYLVYIKQSAIDLTILLFCLLISFRYKEKFTLFSAYSAIIATSLVCNGLMILDQISDANYFYQWHKLRQELAIPIDLIFAIIGSGFSVGNSYNAGSNLRLGDSKRYNRSSGIQIPDRDPKL